MTDDDAPARRPPAVARPRVSAVMPCLNEERTVGICIDKALACFRSMGIDGEVVVSDNGSTDRSIEVAEAHGARVVRQPVRGYGAALQMGIEASQGEIVVIGDADDSYDWSSIDGFVQRIDQGFDLVMGNRFKGGIEPGAMPPLHRFLGNPVLSAVSRIAFRVPVGDFHCGMRAFTREAFQRMQTRTTGMEFATEMIANAAYEGLRICEIPTRLYPDKRDRPPHLRSFRDGWRHLRFILMYAPDHLFLAPGLSMLGFGALLLAALAAGPVDLGRLHFGVHFVALSAMLVLIGFNVVNLGVLAKAILARRHAGLRRGGIGTWLTTRFRLEHGLLTGGSMLAAGIIVDAWILVRWLESGMGSMERTAHLAFVATTVAVLGLNVAFSSFLLAMLQDPGSAPAGSEP